MRRDIEGVAGKVELIVQHVASDLLLSNASDQRHCVSHLLSLWTQCDRNTVLVTGKPTTKNVFSLKLKITTTDTNNVTFEILHCLCLLSSARFTAPSLMIGSEIYFTTHIVEEFKILQNCGLLSVTQKKKLEAPHHEFQRRILSIM